MRGTSARAVLCAIVAIAACRADDGEEPRPSLSRISPTAVSNDAWGLFDRSLSTGFVPAGKPVTVELGRDERVMALKVRGGAPYTLAVTGFAKVDLSKLSADWHTFTPTSATTNPVVVQFAGEGTAAVPELELWGVANTDDVTFAAKEGPQSLKPGACATFKIDVPRSPALFQRVSLVYEATRVVRPFAITRALNGGPAVGGAWMRGAAGAHELREELDPEELKLRDNTLQLCAPASATDGVSISKVRIVGELDRGRYSGTTFPRLIAPEAIANAPSGVDRVDCLAHDGKATSLRFEERGDVLELDGANAACASLSVHAPGPAVDIEVIGSTAGDRVDWPKIVVTSTPEHFGNVAWVNGYVAHPHVMTGAIRVAVGGQPTDSMTGTFGRLVERKADATGAWKVAITVALPDGTKEAAEVVFDRDSRADLVSNAADATVVDTVDVARFGKLGEVAKADANFLTETAVHVGTDAGVLIPAGAVTKPTIITGKRLDHPTLPPLDAGMVNVTAPEGEGYEYLPHGQQFVKDVDVSVPFDAKLIPDGMTEKDVNTYFYNETAHRWQKLDRVSIDVGKGVVHSGSKHFTIMINAVLSVPTSPSPLSFDPTAMSSIAAASPAAGIDLIEAPSANATGDARMALPIRLPSGRGAYTPSLSIGYSSAGDNGWLGVGWDVSISKIEIDTRWGVPRYAAGEEPRYVLDGAELVPTLESEGPTCPTGATTRRYHTRVEGGYSHIVRCGSSPATYYWLVHDRDGTLFTYDTPLASSRAPGIFRWHLHEVKDVNDNTTTFTYQQDDVASTEPSRQMYLSRIDYTSHPLKPAAYSVELLLDDGSRPDRIVDARSGFKMMTRKLLRAVRVKFQDQVIREYVLTYKHGQFAKTLLASTRLYGVGGCSASADAFSTPTCAGEFQEHTFDYHVDVEGFAAATVPPYCANNTQNGCTDETFNSLTKSTTKTIAGTLSAEYANQTGTTTVTGSFSLSSGDRTENVGMYDIDGDGDVDQVFLRNGALHALTYRDKAFNTLPALPITGLTELGFDSNGSWGVDASVAYRSGHKTLGGSVGYSNSTSRAKKLLTDLDGDGYIDFLDASGQSKRSEPCGSGMCFSNVEYNTTKEIDPTQDPALNDAATEINERATPASPVMQWVAPYSGSVKVGALIGLVRPGTIDGVSIGLFLNDQMLGGWSVVSSAAAQSIGASVNVHAGDALYLYISTGANDGGAGLVDEVALSPLAPLMVEYTSACTDATCVKQVDKLVGNEPTGAPVFAFMSSQLRVHAAQPFRAAYEGKVTVHGDVVKKKSAAPLRYCLQKFNADAVSTDYNCQDSSLPGALLSGIISLGQNDVSQVEQTWTVDVKPGEQIVLRAESFFSYDPSALTFAEHAGGPRIFYTEACLPNGDGTCTPTQGEEAEELPVADEAFGFFAQPASSPEPFGSPPLVYVAHGNCEATIRPFENPLGAGTPIIVTFRSDRQGTITTPPAFMCTTTCTPPSQYISLVDGESLSIEIVAGAITAPKFTTVDLSCLVIEGPGRPDEKAPLIFRPILPKRTDSASPFVGNYRGWHTALWNEHEPFAPEELLAKYDDVSTVPGCATPPAPPSDPELCAQGMTKLFETAFQPQAAFDGTPLTNGLPAWIGPQSSAFVVPANGHMNAGSVGGAGATPPAGSGPPAASEGSLYEPGYARLSTTGSYYMGFNLGGAFPQLPVLPGIAPTGFTATVTRSNTKTTTDVLDLTGDGIPDVIAGKKAFQGTIGSGPTTPLGFKFGPIRDRIGADYMISKDLGAAVTVTTPSGRRRFMAAQLKETPDFTFGTTRGLAIGRAETTDDIADINGDGLPDLVQRRGSNINVRYNLGHELGAWETIATMDSALTQPVDAFESFERNSPSILGELLDTSSDALTHETTITENDTFAIGIFIAKGSRTKRLTSSRVTRQLADLNGDGLPDLLVKRAGKKIQVQFNRGADFGPMQEWDTPQWDASLKLTPDFDGSFDPLVKAGSYVVSGADVLAASGLEESTTWSGTLHIPIPKTSIVIGTNGSKAKDIDTFELALMDINGDGRPDHVLRRKAADGAKSVYVKSNRVTLASNLLEDVHRPLGGLIHLRYQPQPTSQDMPHARAVLSSVEVDDGQTLASDFASPSLFTTFKYDFPYYNRLEKQFMGFARITSKRADGGSVEQYYDTHNYTLHGLLLSEIRRDSAFKVVHEHRMTYQVQDVIGPSGALTADPACVAALHPLLQRLPNNEACTPRVPVLQQDDDIQGELGTVTTKTHTVRDTSFDRFGNVLSSGDGGDPSLLTDDLSLTAEYANDVTRWIIGRPTFVEAKYVPPGVLGMMILRSRTGEYDVRGRLTKIVVKTGINGNAITTLGYDAFGNVNHVETPPNANGEIQTYDVTFDPIVATYPVTTTDGFGYTSTASYDLRFGAATAQTDVNGTQLTRTLDGFGRLKTVRGPYDGGTAGITFDYYPNESLPRAVSVTRPTAPSDYTGPLPQPVTTVTIGDGYGRVVELRKTAVVDGALGMTTSGLVQRDNLGRVTKSWHPFFTPGVTTGFVTPTTMYATTMTYDELDRVRTTTQPNGDVETMSYAIASSPGLGAPMFQTVHTVVVPGLPRVRESYSDQMGRMRAFVEHPTTTTSSVTTYDYYATGELRTIKDAEGKTTTLAYDMRGLRTLMSSADLGLRQYVYDLMGNQVALIEPNHRALNTQVNYQYNRNRLTKVDYPSKPDVTFEYGAPGASNNAAGRITRITDETGTIDYSYGAFGETRRVLRTFNPTGASQALRFDQRFTFDSIGRQLQLRYPDGEIITNVYDEAGALKEVRGAGDGWERSYAKNMQYDVFGNRTRMDVGRVTSTWSYDPASVRLTNLVSTLQPPGGTASQIQNLSYTYDAANNPTQITNTLSTPLMTTGAMPRSSSVSLTYDGVDRLTTAEGVGQQDRFYSTDYWESFTYTPSHNLATKTRSHTLSRPPHISVTPPATNFALTYTYSTRPHLPDKVGSLQLSYDPSGNPTTRADTTSGVTQNLTWDDDGRLVQLTDTSGVVQNNLYDSNGLRVRRKTTTANGARTTIFASQYFDLEGEQASSNGGIKHIFAGGQRIATVLGSFTSSNNPTAPATPGVPYYVHGDHLGSTTVVTDDQGSVTQSMEYFVDGEAWIDHSPSTPVNGYLFNGKPYDPETKFYNYGQRFYDPRTSLWLGVDRAFNGSPDLAVGKPFILSVGAYAANNPVRLGDPDGNYPGAVGPLSGLVALPPPPAGAAPIIGNQNAVGPDGANFGGPKLKGAVFNDPPLPPNTVTYGSTNPQPTMGSASPSDYRPRKPEPTCGPQNSARRRPLLSVDLNLDSEGRDRSSQGRYVYRQLSYDDRLAFMAGEGLSPKAPGGTIADHVAGRDTKHVSASLTAGATARFDSGNGLVKIDVAKAMGLGSGFVDHYNVLLDVGRQYGTASIHFKNAVTAEEVLFTNGIPYDAMTLEREGRNWSQ